jgi:hypothetical protein
MSATEQIANIKPCVLLYKSPLQTLQMLEEAYGKVAVKKMQVHEWHKRSCIDCISAHEDLFCGQPSTLIEEENIKCVHNAV